jgi:ClpP class serine protease
MSIIANLSDEEYARYIANPDKAFTPRAQREDTRAASKGVKGRHTPRIKVIPRDGTVTFRGNPRKPVELSVRKSAKLLAKLGL